MQSKPSSFFEIIFSIISMLTPALATSLTKTHSLFTKFKAFLSDICLSFPPSINLKLSSKLFIYSKSSLFETIIISSKYGLNLLATCCQRGSCPTLIHCFFTPRLNLVEPPAAKSIKEIKFCLLFIKL